MADDDVINTPTLKTLIEIARTDTDFDLFYRRFVMINRLTALGSERLSILPSQSWYRDFLMLVGEYRRKTKFERQESDIRAQLKGKLERERDRGKRQCLALAILISGDIRSGVSRLERSILPKKLLDDLSTFLNWASLTDGSLVSHEIDPGLQRMFEHNRHVFELLRTKYAELIRRFATTDWDSVEFEHVTPRDYKVFFCWFQGKANMPPLIRCCFNSVKRNIGDRELCFIDETNYSEYVELPEHVIRKFKEGKITRTHFSDILRVNLLERYGGLWLDSTILITEPFDRHKDFWSMPYFTQKYCTEKNDDNKYVKAFRCYVSYARWAAFLLGSCVKHHPLFAFAKEFFNAYWRDFDQLIDYVLLDYVVDIAYENIPIVHRHQDAVPINNIGINDLVFHLNEPYEKYPFDKVLAGNFINKLSWKAPLDLESKGTVFDEIRRRYG